MNLNVFVLFPQNEDTIIDIVNDKNSFQNFIEYTVELIKESNDTHKVNLFYDEENIKFFLHQCKVLDDAVYLESSPSILRSAFTKKANQITDYSLKNEECIYFIWNINETIQSNATVPIVLQEAAERFWNHEKVLVLNLKKTLPADREYLIVFKDALHLENHPHTFARIPFISTLNELIEWTRKNHATSFSLTNTKYFKRTSMVQQGQTVYEEIKTGYFWYLDNLHKDHYEVFDSTRNHFGVADLDGNIDVTKRKKGRTF